MALDKEYFDSISIDVVKKKYYNANKVNAVLDDIRTQADELTAENLRLRSQAQGLSQQKTDICEALMSAQAVARDIIKRANDDAAKIIRSAESRRDEILNGSDRTQEHAVMCVENCLSRLRQQQEETIELINSQWQEFLCGLEIAKSGPEVTADAKPAPAPVQPQAPVQTAPVSAPADAEDFDDAEGLPSTEELEARVDAIAKELMEILSK